MGAGTQLSIPEMRRLSKVSKNRNYETKILYQSDELTKFIKDGFNELKEKTLNIQKMDLGEDETWNYYETIVKEINESIIEKANKSGMPPETIAKFKDFNIKDLYFSKGYPGYQDDKCESCNDGKKCTIHWPELLEND